MFFMVMTVIMGFLINWVFGSFFSACTCSHEKKRIIELQKLDRHIPPSNIQDDIDDLLG